MQRKLHSLKHKVAGRQCLKKQASQLANQSKRLESPWDGGHCLTMCLLCQLCGYPREEGDHPKLGSDVETDDAIYPPSGYEKISNSRDEGFWREQCGLPSRSRNSLRAGKGGQIGFYGGLKVGLG